MFFNLLKQKLLNIFPDCLYETPRLLTTRLYLHIFNFLIFWPHHTSRGILVPQPGANLCPSLEVQGLNHRTIREVPVFQYLSCSFLLSITITTAFPLRECWAIEGIGDFHWSKTKIQLSKLEDLIGFLQ